MNGWCVLIPCDSLKMLYNEAVWLTSKGPVSWSKRSSIQHECRCCWKLKGALQGWAAHCYYIWRYNSRCLDANVDDSVFGRLRDSRKTTSRWETCRVLSSYKRFIRDLWYVASLTHSLPEILHVNSRVFRKQHSQYCLSHISLARDCALSQKSVKWQQRLK